MKWVAVLMAVGLNCSCAERSDFAVVAIEDGERLLRPCTRTAPRVDSYFAPESAAIANAESHLGQIEALSSEISLANSFRQYIGVTIDSKPFLYVNAVSRGDIEILQRLDRSQFDASDPIIICDGGASTWGALYDMETSVFFSLAIDEAGG